MGKKIIIGFCMMCVTLVNIAQTPQAMSSADILVGLKKLNVLGTVLYVAAHPDDENTRLLAYLAKDKLYRTGYMALTRGDGGQNLIGDEQGIELGMIRTQELLSARRVDGAEQFFSRAYDFGFSKSTEEALQFWDKQKILSDVVWVIRKFRPDVVIARFPKDSRAGHGHHSASAVLAEEAFIAAGDPTKFPEQLQYVQPWKPKRLLWNTFNFGTVNTQSNDQFKIDVGTYNPILGKGYGEIAAESRSQHKSQGFGVPRQRGTALEYFTTWQGDAPVSELTDGVDISWKKIKGSEAVQQNINTIIDQFSFTAPGKSVKLLVALYKQIGQLENGYWKEQKMKEVQQLIEACSGLWAEATTTEAMAVQTDSIKINFFLNNRNGNTVVLKKISIASFDSTVNKNLESNTNYSFTKSLLVPDSMPLSQPYWLQNEMKEGYFDVRNQLLIGKAQSDASFTVDYVLNIEGEDFKFTKSVMQKFTDPVKGELYQPVVVVPPVLITPAKSLFISTSAQPQTLQYHYRAMTDSIKPQLQLAEVPGWKSTIQNYFTGDVLKKGSEAEVTVTLTPVSKNLSGKQPVLSSVKTNGELYASLKRSIHYDHIPNIDYFRTPIVNILSLDLKTAGKKIAYIEGAGDYVATALQQMGYDVTVLNDKDLAVANLSQYDAIVTGVRAYNIKASLNDAYEKLMKYVENGGNLIVQYNTSNQIGPIKAKMSPYPFNISRTRVTDEQAAVKVLKPDHAVMNFPNKIAAKDFEGWVQERSIYHASNWDAQYETVFSMGDAGEKEDEGSLIIGKYGKGVFVYTGLVFFRELPAGVPGAYRLFANIIALNQKRGF